VGVCGTECVSVNVCCDIGRDRVCVYWHAPRQIMFVYRFAKMLSYKHVSTILNTFKTCMKYACIIRPSNKVRGRGLWIDCKFKICFCACQLYLIYNV